MKPAILLLVAVLVCAGLLGCVTVGGDEPLVDLGDHPRSSPAVRDPSPGTRYEDLSDEDQLRRRLAQCQDELAEREHKYRVLKKKFEDCKDRVDDLEDRIEDLRD